MAEQNKINYPLISVIVPSMGRDTLVRTIQSILNSCYPNLEILVSASGDGVTGIASKLNFPYVKLVWWESQKVSPAKAKNEALKHAKGKYVTFIDDDDTCYPAKFFNLSKHLEDNPETFGAFGQYNVRDCSSGNIKNRNCGGGVPVNFKTLLKTNYIASGSIMLRNKEAVYFDETLPHGWGEDYKLWLKLVAKYRIDFVPVVVYAWTQNVKSGFTSWLKNWRELTKNIQEEAKTKYGTL